MENDQKQLEKKNFEFWITTIGIGVVFLISVFLVSMNSDMEKAHSSMKDTLSYVKSQCSMYARYNGASITKSTMRVMENTQQVVRNLEQDNRITCGKLEEYAREQRLTGIFILSEDGSVVCEYHRGAYGPEELRTYIQKEAVLDVAEYPEKTYAHRIEYEDGSYIDLAANGRIDKKGVVIGYYHTSAEYAKNYSLTLQNLLYGYHTQTDGTIIVTDGSDITASNDTSLAGRAVSENALLERTSHVRNAANPFYVKDVSGKSYIGNMEKTQDFYIYIFLPVVQVYDMLQNAGATVIKASDGQDAVDRFVESEPGQIDIILMDIMMPVMDGLMATGRIRTLNRPDAQTIPIIAMTANAFMEDRIQALNAGMDEHLTKPLESAVLIRTIAEFVRKNGSEKRS